ncbi:MAG: cofactor assembly of complex C subunit B [Cyanobacteria bacterium P01_A01_bin.84]
MDIPVLPSTLLLTLLLMIGLIFFIRASAKDRTQTVKLGSQKDEAVLMPQLQDYFQARSYRVAAIDPLTNQVTMTGFVRPSLFLAVFLSLLAAVGLLCLSLVVLQLFPGLNLALLGIVLLSPCAGIFYWKKAGRVENVLLQLDKTESTDKFSSKLTVIAHRDELLEIQRALQLVSIE